MDNLIHEVRKRRLLVQLAAMNRDRALDRYLSTAAPSAAVPAAASLALREFSAWSAANREAVVAELALHAAVTRLYRARSDSPGGLRDSRT